MHEASWQHDRRWQGVPWLEPVIGNGGDGWKIAGLGLAAVEAARDWRAPGELHMMPLRVLNLRMGQRPHQCPVLTSLSQFRQVLTYLNPRRLCRNGIKFTAHLFGRIRLHVKTIVLTQSARKKNVDYPLCTWSLVVCWLSSPQRIQMIHSQPKKSNRPCLQRNAS